LIGQEKDGEYLSYHFDFRGSTVALSDSSGAVVEKFQYSPFGVLVKGNASKTPFLFNGMYGVMTDENGLLYMRARFYSPEIRRFVNRDVLLGGIADGQTLNRFAFVGGKPVSFVDPFGLERQAVLTMDEVEVLFNKMAKMPLAFHNANDGCHARAYLMSEAMLEMGYIPFKYWAFSNGYPLLSIKGKEDDVKWWGFHVAPGVFVKQNGKIVDMVIDPALFDKPVTFTDWLSILNNVNSSSRSAYSAAPTINLNGEQYTYPGSFVPGRPDSDFPSSGFLGWGSLGTMRQEAEKLINSLK